MMWYSIFKWLSWIGGYGFLVALVVGAALVYAGANSRNPYGGMMEFFLSLQVLAVLFVVFVIGVIGRWLS